MTVTESLILTQENIPGYLKERWSELSSVLGIDNNNDISGNVDHEEEDIFSHLRVQPITGGNVNYAFCLTLTVPKKQETTNNGTLLLLFLKQAPEFVAIFGPLGFPLTSERLQLEINVYQEWNQLLGKQLANLYLPTIYYFDKSRMAVIMEFLEGHELLDHVLMKQDNHFILDLDHIHQTKIASSLGDFMGRTHAVSHSSVITPEKIAYYTTNYENRAMRDVQLQFVFTKCYQEATDEQRAGLQLTSEFMQQVELLKQQYNGTSDSCGYVLSHGDLHPGSVMIHPGTGSCKIIDPEFTVYGPAGLDVGSLLSGYCLGAIHQAFSGHTAEADAILRAAQAIWNAYVKSFQANYTIITTTDDTNTSNLNDWMQAIAVETVGFTVAEVCRTALEFAGGRKWLQFNAGPDDDDDENDKAKSAAAKKAALELVQNCMVARHDGGIDLLWKEIEAVCKKAITVTA